MRLESQDGSVGTGFFFYFEFGDKKVPVLISNKHVINNNPNEKMKFQLHLYDLMDQTNPLNESFSVEYQTM